jgi:uncharacterized protein (DUF1330 family)
MPAYVIAAVTEAHDDEALTEYRKRNTAAVEGHGGRFVVRGGPVEVLEGDWAPLRVVVMEFDDAEAARGWYESPEYSELRAVRERASDGELVITEGLGA